jgi:hypothetical protein
MGNKKNAHIEIDIKYGLEIRKAEFNVFNSNNNIICLSMYIDGLKQPEHTQTNYFRTNEDEIKKEYYKRYGNL